MRVAQHTKLFISHRLDTVQPPNGIFGFAQVINQNDFKVLVASAFQNTLDTTGDQGKLITCWNQDRYQRPLGVAVAQMVSTRTSLQHRPPLIATGIQMAAQRVEFIKVALGSIEVADHQQLIDMTNT
ncbi:hypothetical protein D3C77_225370 [compost metagenome]